MDKIPRHPTLLAFSTFAMGTEASVYAGHLASLSRDLAVSVPRAGLLAAAFTGTLAISAPVLAWLTRRLDRKAMLVAGLALVAALNALVATVVTFAGLLAIRVSCGLVAGLIGPSASTAAALFSPPERRGRAMGTQHDGGEWASPPVGKLITR